MHNLPTTLHAVSYASSSYSIQPTTRPSAYHGAGAAGSGSI